MLYLLLGRASLPSKNYKKEATVNFNVRLELITIVITILLATLDSKHDEQQ